MRRQDCQKATLLMLAYESAGRRAELAQVEKYSFLDPIRNNTNTVIGKGRKKFSLIYFDLTRKAALAWLDQRGEDDISELTNYKNGTHHVCRDLGKPGFSLDQLKILAHHDSMETTLSYLPDIDNEELEGMFGIEIKS
jgi:hypothetical protein